MDNSLNQLLTLEQKSYIYGLLLTDGSIYRVKNKNSYETKLELGIVDSDIIEKLIKLIPYSTKRDRERDTNFKNNYQTIIFSNYRKELPELLFSMGFPQENKTEMAYPPKVDYDVGAFWRGVIDGDGSLGIRKQANSNKKEPYLSLTTKSEELKEAYCSFLTNITAKSYNPKRNKRDNIYNITCALSSAKRILDKIYQNATIYLDRKYQKYLEINDFVQETQMLMPPLYILLQFNKETKELIRVYNTCGEAEKITGFKHLADASCKNSRYKTYQGYIWKRIYEGEDGYDRDLVNLWR